MTAVHQKYQKPANKDDKEIPPNSYAVEQTEHEQNWDIRSIAFSLTITMLRLRLCTIIQMMNHRGDIMLKRKQSIICEKSFLDR